MQKLCSVCGQRAVIRHTFSKQLFCAHCFICNFVSEVHEYIQREQLIPSNSNIVIGVSGGKDSSVLTDVLCKILSQHEEDYKNVRLHLVAVDEGIHGYRDLSLDTVRAIAQQYELPLQIVSFKDYFRRSLDEIYQIQPTNTCSYCGILRRNSLEQAAFSLGLDNMRIATGHNADDNAETVFMNMMRGDSAKLQRCVDPISSLQGDGARIKPLAFESQKDIVLYAFHAKVKYFSTECPYAVTAFRGVARRLVNELNGCQNNVQLGVLRDIRGNRSVEIRATVRPEVCEKCGCVKSGKVCQVCMIKQAETAEDFKAVLKLK